MAKPVGADKIRKSKTPHQIFGRGVTEMRVAKKISQVVLASELGYSIGYMGQIERGDANVTIDVMAAVSGYFELSIGQFWTYAERLAARSVKKR